MIAEMPLCRELPGHLITATRCTTRMCFQLLGGGSDVAALVTNKQSPSPNKSLGCTLPHNPTSHALLTSSTPRQRELVCGACIGTTQVAASLAAPLNSLFKRSTLRSPRDIILVFVT